MRTIQYDETFVAYEADGHVTDEQKIEHAGRRFVYPLTGVLDYFVKNDDGTSSAVFIPDTRFGMPPGTTITLGFGALVPEPVELTEVELPALVPGDVPGAAPGTAPAADRA